MRQSCGPVMARSWLQMEKKSRNLTCMLPLFAWTWYSHYAWLKRNKSSYGLAQKKSRAAGIFFPRQQAQWNFAALLAPLGPQNFGLLGPPGPHIIGLSTLARPWTVVGVVGHHLPLLPVSAVLPWRRRRIWVLCRCWRLALGLGSNLGCGLHVGSRLLASWLLEHLHGDQGSCRLLEDHDFLGHGAGRGSSCESVAAVVCMHRSIRGLEAVGTTGFLYMARSWLQVEKKSRNLTCMLPLFAWTWYSHYAWLKRNKSSYGLAQKKSRAAGIFFPRQQAQWNFAALLAPLGPQNFGLLGPPGPHIIGLSTLARPWTVVGVVGHHLPLLPVSAVLPWRRRRIWVLCRCWRLALGLGSNLAWPSHWQPASCQLACGAPSWRSRQLQAS